MKDLVGFADKLTSIERNARGNGIYVGTLIRGAQLPYHVGKTSLPALFFLSCFPRGVAGS